MKSSRGPAFGFTSKERLEYEQTLLRLLFATRLESFLEDVGLQQQELAARMGKSKAWISKLLSGSQNATVDSLAEAAFALGLRWDASLYSVSRTGTPAEPDKDPPRWVQREPVSFTPYIESIRIFGVIGNPPQEATTVGISSLWYQQDIGASWPASRYRAQVIKFPGIIVQNHLDVEQRPMSISVVAGRQ